MDKMLIFLKNSLKITEKVIQNIFWSFLECFAVNYGAVLSNKNQYLKSIFNTFTYYEHEISLQIIKTQINHKMDEYDFGVVLSQDNS